jgi:TolA-binding protein
MEIPEMKSRSNSRVFLQAVTFAFLCAGLFAGCLQTREDQKELDEKVVVRKQLSTLQQSTADVNSRFQDLEDETRKLNGRIETLEAKDQARELKHEKTIASIEAHSKESDQAYREEFTKLTSEITALKDQVTGMQSVLDEHRKAQAAKVEADQARAQQANKNPLATAEELYEKKQWKDAVLSYEKYRAQNPKGKSFASATYKIGVCFQELGMNEDAQAFYEEVLNKFPKSKDAEKAASRLKKMKK